MEVAEHFQSEHPEVTLPGAPEMAERTWVLQRLTAEWRAAWGKLGLPSSATIVDVARKLDVDRGTAQRLNRIAKLAEVEAHDVGHFPGVRAWHRVLIGVENALGTEDPNYKQLSVACDHFAKWIGEMGGSRSSAMRQMANGNGNGESSLQQNSNTSNGSTAGMANGSTAGTARSRWVDAAIECLGYGVDIRLDVTMARDTVESPKKIDLVTINCMRGCRGGPGAMPIAFSRAAYSVDHKVIEGGKGKDARAFHVLRSATSRPAPAILTTGDASRQTIFVEPQWTSMHEPLDLAVMHEERGAFPSPWETPHEWLEFSTINRHPNRKLVLERYVSREIDSMCVAALRTFRSHFLLAHDEPWFDRIPEDSPVVRVGSMADAISAELFPGYAAMIDEAMGRLNWDADDLVLYRAVIDNPITFATYTIMFDRVRP